MGAPNKPSDVITFRLRAAPTLQQHKTLMWCKLLRDSYIAQASRTTAMAQSGSRQRIGVTVRSLGFLKLPAPFLLTPIRQVV